MRIAVPTIMALALWPGQALCQQAQPLPPIVVAPPPPPPTASAAPPMKSTPQAEPDAPARTTVGEANAIDAIDPRANDVGVAQSGSQGVVPRDEIEARPLYRTGDMLEAVPGLVVTQHSGEGKANQYFLRGFNLDH